MIKRLSRCVREYKKDTILTPLFVLLEVVMDIVIPLLMAELIDKGIDRGDMRAVLIYGAGLLVCALLVLLFGVSAGSRAAYASAGFSSNVRKDMYHNIQNFSFSNIDRFSTASLVTRLTTDVSNVQMAFQMLIRMAVRAPLMLVFALIVSFGIHARLSLIFLLCLPVLGAGLYLISSRAHPIFIKMFKAYDRMNNVVRENLRGIRVVKSFIREGHESDKFSGSAQEIYDLSVGAEKLLICNMPLMMFCMYASMLLLSWFGARVIVQSGGAELTTGQLMSLITYAMQILMSLMMLSMMFVMTTMARASAERITEVLDEKSDLQEPEDALTELTDGGIRFENVSFSYTGDGKRMALKHVDIDIAPGETVGILGGTGSAKSTLVQLIPRLYDATEGRVLVGGRDVREYSLRTLRDGVAMVLQNNVLFSGTVAENLRWGDPGASDAELRRVCALAQADGFISEFPDGYDTHIEQGGSNVSGGQKQRLCIARALLKKPKVLILDDSTSAVDTATDARIRRAFREELPEVTKLIIAQRVASVQDADKIIVMGGGRVLAVGGHDELMQTSDIYREVYESQMSGGDFDESE